MSHFLFIIMVEVLRRHCHLARLEGRIQGIQITQSGWEVSHQEFADHTMLFGTTREREAR